MSIENTIKGPTNFSSFISGRFFFHSLLFVFTKWINVNFSEITFYDSLDKTYAICYIASDIVHSIYFGFYMWIGVDVRAANKEEA